MRSSVTSTRRRSNSARSSTSNAGGGASDLARSNATQRPNSCSPTPISRATVAIGRPVSITRCAASRRNAGLKLRRLPFLADAMPTSFPAEAQRPSQPPGVRQTGEPHLSVGARVLEFSLGVEGVLSCAVIRDDRTSSAESPLAWTDRPDCVAARTGRVSRHRNTLVPGHSSRMEIARLNRRFRSRSAERLVAHGQ